VENNNSSAKSPTYLDHRDYQERHQHIMGRLFETNRNSGIGVARQRRTPTPKAPFLNRNEFRRQRGRAGYIPKLYNGKNKSFWCSSRNLPG